VLVLGGSGATGKCLVQQLVDCDRILSVTNVGRKNYTCFPSSSKLEQVVVPDLADMGDLKLTNESYDLAFVTIGTTRADAGSDEAFKLVDYTYVMEFANLCKRLNVRAFHLLSSVGADKSSWFLYPRTKGEAENDVAGLKFPISCAYRAPLLERGSDARTAEKFGSLFLSSMSTEVVAQCLLMNALSTFPEPDFTGNKHDTLEHSAMEKVVKKKKDKK